jgi:hypothetical protein
MVSVQLEDQKTENDEVKGYSYTILAIPSPSKISPLLEDKLKEDLYKLYPESDSPFAVEIEIDQVNDRRQSMFIEVRIKDGNDLNEVSLAEHIKRSVEFLVSSTA